MKFLYILAYQKINFKTLKSALRALEMVLAEPSRSIGDFVTEKSRGASPQIEAGRSEANPAAASAINQVYICKNII